MDSRQSHIWSHRISIRFQLYKRSRLNLQEIDGEYERSKWLRGSTGEHRRSTGEHRRSMGEHRGSMKEHGRSILTKRALKGSKSARLKLATGDVLPLSSGNINVFIRAFITPIRQGWDLCSQHNIDQLIIKEGYGPNDKHNQPKNKYHYLSDLRHPQRRRLIEESPLPYGGVYACRTPDCPKSIYIHGRIIKSEMEKSRNYKVRISYMPPFPSKSRCPMPRPEPTRGYQLNHTNTIAIHEIKTASAPNRGFIPKDIPEFCPTLGTV